MRPKAIKLKNQYLSKVRKADEAADEYVQKYLVDVPVLMAYLVQSSLQTLSSLVTSTQLHPALPRRTLGQLPLEPYLSQSALPNVSRMYSARPPMRRLHPQSDRPSLSLRRCTSQPKTRVKARP